MSAAVIFAAIAVWPLQPASSAQDAPPPAEQSAPAAPPPGAAPTTEPSLRSTGQTTHGWIVERDESRGWSTLWHFPPRTASSHGDDRLPVRAAAGFGTPIERWAGHGSRVYMLSIEERVGAVSDTAATRRRSSAEGVSSIAATPGHARQRRLLSIAAVPASAPSIRAGASAPQVWIYPPGRPEVLPALTVPGDLLDMTATGHGPVVLLRRRDLPSAGVEPDAADQDSGESIRPHEPLPLHLVALSGDRWQTLPLPAALGPRDRQGALEMVLSLVALPPSASPATTGRSGEAAALALETIGLVAIDPSDQLITLWRGLLRPQPRSAMGDSAPTGGAAVMVQTGQPLPTLTIEWTAEPLAWPEAWRIVPSAAIGARVRAETSDLPDRVLAIDGQLLALRHKPEPGLIITALRSRESVELTTVPGLPRKFEAHAADGSGVIAILWRPRSVDARPDRTVATAPPSVEPPLPRSPADPQLALGWRVLELSAFTGRVLDERTSKPSGPLSLPEFQLLAGLLVFVMIAVVLFILRSEPAGAAPLPRKTVLAEPGRRLVAGLLDFIPAVLLAAWVTGEQPTSFLNPLSFLSGESGLQPLLLALGSACLHCTLGEWLSGASLGKSLARCMVISGQGSVRSSPGHTPAESTLVPRARAHRPYRIELWQAALRNIIKWSMPPLAALCVVDLLRRHPGDLAAKTLVITPEPEPEDD